jgi:CheY-like chemotaxis protein
VDLKRAEVSASAPLVDLPALASSGGRQDTLVMYVEDDPTNELLMRAVVEGRLGYRYVSAPTAEEGLRVARELRPAVMLVDLNLPGHDGVWLAEQILGDLALAGTPLIALTADATPQTRRRLLAAGFRDCWSKPFEIDAVDLGLRLHAPRPPSPQLSLPASALR